MCLLTFFDEGSMPNMGRLETGAKNNDDGHGFAIADMDNRSLIVYKHMEKDRVLEAFEDLREKHPDGPALFHSRIGTAGDYNASNCHPFYVGGDKRTVIGHNGILPSKAQPQLTDYRSDTRLLAEVFLPKHRFGSVHTHGGRKQLGKWAGAGNKFAILTVDPALIPGTAPARGWIVNEEQGDWIDGVWYSNSSHEYVQRYYGTGYYGSSYSDSRGFYVTKDDGSLRWVETGSGGTCELYPGEGQVLGTPKGSARETECPFCNAIDQWIPDLPDICQACWTCRVCLEDLTVCQCVEDVPNSTVNDYVTWWEESCNAQVDEGPKGLWNVD